ncbi:hypothetical protein GALL_474460 [mine drainage metagenome]|uniref:Uncharacterized protein n=1 Tax=mine drainage metagenome TaxID=410659 RepID=A0A1J5PIC4_9ZZZZ
MFRAGGDHLIDDLVMARLIFERGHDQKGGGFAGIQLEGRLSVVARLVPFALMQRQDGQGAAGIGIVGIQGRGAGLRHARFLHVAQRPERQAGPVMGGGEVRLIGQGGGEGA